MIFMPEHKANSAPKLNSLFYIIYFQQSYATLHLIGATQEALHFIGANLNF